MSVSFDAQQGLVVVRTLVSGPSGIAVLRLALDTGATRTVINGSLLVAVGYDPGAALERTEVTTGSGVEFAAPVSVSTIVDFQNGRLTLAEPADAPDGPGAQPST